MKLGIVGLPNVGKSTLFNSLTKAGAESANYPFCTIDPNVGVVTVPDERLALLGDFYHSKKVTPAVIEFVDIAGLVKGASKGEGLGNQFLANIREVDAIVHVVRCFEDTNVIHVDGSIDPIRDIETINLELIFSDLEILERRIAKVTKTARMDKEAAKELDFLQKIKKWLEDGKMAITMELEIGEMRSIKVNDYLQTSDEHIYAVGDAIEFRHPLTDRPWLNYLAGPANRQARIVADNMVFGNKVTYEGAVGTSIAKIFDMTVAASGLPAKRLKQAGIDYLSATIHSGSHAGYYPDALQMSIKITFSPVNGKLLGAQIVGYNGVDKRIDEFSQVIKHNGTVYDLMALEQAYAPPFSSAKDPVAVAGYVAGNILSGKMKPLYWRELQAADLSKVTLVDVRTPDEFALGALKGAVNIPLDDMRERMKEIPQDKPVYLYCGVGLRGYLASNILLQNGFGEVRNLIGGLKLYKAATAPLPKPKEFSNSGSSSSDSSKVDHSEHSKDSAEAYTIASSVIPSMKAIKVDACGISCPGPIMKLKKSMEELADGERLEIVATDAGFPRDAEAWCQTTGNRFVSVKSGAGKYEVIVEKSTPQSSSSEVCREDKGKTFILFSDDLDKVLATFVLANGAAATGKKVTIFFTFWGLNAIKRLDKPAVKKDIWGKMFGMMLPSSSLKLRLSKMNMGGMGARMMRYIMNKKNIDSLESLRTQAIQNGVEFIACQMSMDVMGVKREELLDHVTIGGVATYMNRAEQANVNLFI